MAKKYSLNEIKLLGDRKFFFDANILLYIFWPTGAYALEKSYSALFKSLLNNKCEMIVDMTVVSETINRAHRIEYKKHIQILGLTEKQFTYKNYRNSQEGKDAMSDIYTIIEDNVLKVFSVVGKAFIKSEIESMLVVETIDINDKAIAMLCRENNFILTTNDADFNCADLELLSANTKILSV